ncbi:hypothetical protein EV356DRAFT_529977 [Viridothelium virens]|uniref:Uncharacterized protein n=1 Tax=Viridothelium virens TaxID=1048519 RepID=A0A6A6HID3_VIRVR|nr:hypothetical protein EV356DRAFT_529977 [Viridothelium virens]
MPTAIEPPLLRLDEGVDVGFAVGNEDVDVDNELACVLDEDKEVRIENGEVGEEDSSGGTQNEDASDNEDKVVGESSNVSEVPDKAMIDDSTNVANEEAEVIGELAAVACSLDCKTSKESLLHLRARRMIATSVERNTASNVYNLHQRDLIQKVTDLYMKENS